MVVDVLCFKCQQDDEDELDTDEETEDKIQTEDDIRLSILIKIRNWKRKEQQSGQVLHHTFQVRLYNM